MLIDFSLISQNKTHAYWFQFDISKQTYPSWFQFNVSEQDTLLGDIALDLHDACEFLERSGGTNNPTIISICTEHRVKRKVQPGREWPNAEVPYTIVSADFRECW